MLKTSHHLILQNLHRLLLPERGLVSSITYHPCQASETFIPVDLDKDVTYLCNNPACNVHRSFPSHHGKLPERLVLQHSSGRWAQS